jgi:hypothetical protein
LVGGRMKTPRDVAKTSTSSTRNAIVFKEDYQYYGARIFIWNKQTIYMERR